MEKLEKESKKAYAAALLVKRRKELGRLPLRKDFDDKTVCFIKQVLGPWPRALEAAGLKEASSVSQKEKNRLKHEAQRKRRKLGKRAKRQEQSPEMVSQAGAGRNRQVKDAVKLPENSTENDSE